MVGSLTDVRELFRLADDAGVPLFSSSAYRFYDSLQQVKSAEVGDVRAVISVGPAHLEPHHPDLFLYGVHPTEALFTIMGTGCETVVRTSTPDTDVVSGTWSGGRVGTLVGLRSGPTPHRVTVFGTKAMAEQTGGGDYAPLVRAILEFFRTGVPPVSPRETLELFAFMEAADRSKQSGGSPIRIADLLERGEGAGDPSPADR
jgi:hypothetical protein